MRLIIIIWLFVISIIAMNQLRLLFPTINWLQMFGFDMFGFLAAIMDEVRDYF